METPSRRGPVLFCLGLLLALVILSWTVPLPTRLTVAGSTVLLYQDGSPAHVFLSSDQKWRIPTDLDEVDPDYLRALFALEDARFPLHPGVDPMAVGRAALSNLSAGHVVSGASTLSMQLVRMLEPRPRIFRSKAIEALRALQLEVRLEKRTILEEYLSYLPYGRNVEGLEAAALWYFGHPAKDLSPVEIATLLAVPQDPNHRFPTPAHRQHLQEARDEILKKLIAAGIFPPDPIPPPPVPEQIQPIPRAMPHAAIWMRDQLPGVIRLHSTLDGGIQRRVEQALDQVQSLREQEGIHNAAIVVVDHQTATIRALAGNFDFWSQRDGQIAAFAEPRSPGSALKPFVYAQAIDTGVALPGFLVADAPVHFGSYSPENYDGAWSGMVPLEEALSRSLNVPFIHLLSDIGVERFLGLLRQGGAKHLDPMPGHYGLSLVAGSIEISPLELAGLYVALAEDGRWRPLRWQPEAAVVEGQRLFSEGAAWLTRKALRLRDRPDFPSRASVALPAGIHWKTGTSFGNRDAWAVGSGERYTVVVWMGNLDNRPSSHLIGAEVAAPLLFDILDALDDRQQTEDPPPAELVPVQVCALSGRPPEAGCDEIRTVLARQTHVPTDRCPLHERVELNEEGMRVNAACRQGATHYETRVAWPATVRRWLGSRLSAEAEVPPWAEGCQPPEGRPRILSPADRTILLLIPGMAADRQELPLESSGGEPPFSWFVDGRLLGQSDGERLWWTPTLGSHQLLVQDGGGGSAQVNIEVQNQR